MAKTISAARLKQEILNIFEKYFAGTLVTPEELSNLLAERGIEASDGEVIDRITDLICAGSIKLMPDNRSDGLVFALSKL